MSRLSQNGYGQNADDIRCAMDISASIEAVTRMVNVIADALDDCDVAFNGDDGECGQAVGVLTRASAGLSASSAGVLAKCPSELNGFQPMHTVASTFAAIPGKKANYKLPQTGLGSSFGQCIVHVKATMTSIFKAVKRIMTIPHECKDPTDHDCVDNAIKIVSAFSAIGSSLAGALGECTPSTAPNADKTKDQSECAQHSLALVQQVNNVFRSGVELDHKCHVDDFDRLYIDGGAEEKKKEDNSVTRVLAALIPLTAVVSFIGGSRIARSQARDMDSESLQPMADVE